MTAATDNGTGQASLIVPKHRQDNDDLTMLQVHETKKKMSGQLREEEYLRALVSMCV